MIRAVDSPIEFTRYFAHGANAPCPMPHTLHIITIQCLFRVMLKFFDFEAFVKLPLLAERKQPKAHRVHAAEAIAGRPDQHAYTLQDVTMELKPLMIAALEKDGSAPRTADDNQVRCRSTACN